MGDKFREFSLNFVHFKKLRCFLTLPSTNIKLSELIEKGLNIPDVIVAGRQTEGKGRRDNYWFSPNCGLWMSILFPDIISKINITAINIFCGLACAKACNTVLKRVGAINLNILVRWPNDLILEDKKLGGLLIEVKTEGVSRKYIIIGIGINVNQKRFPDSLKDSAISFFKVLKKRISRKNLLFEILTELDRMIINIKQKGFNNWQREWNRYSYEIGKNIEIDIGNGVKKYGRVLGIGECGELIIIDKSDNITKIFNGYDLKILDW